MYRLSTAGYGYSWGHVFAAIDLEHPIVDKGTFYFQIAMGGVDNDFHVALSDLATQSVEPPDPTNPWGWSGPSDWGDMRPQVLKNYASEQIRVRDGASFADTQFAWKPGAWYEMWMTVDVDAEIYRVHVRSPEAGIGEQIILMSVFERDVYDEYFFRSTADQLRSVLLATIAGNPGNPLSVV